jgi:hypothetical protein
MPSEVSIAGAVEELRLELSEAHRREAATAKVLQIISPSTFNLREVLDSLIATCGRLAPRWGSSIGNRNYVRAQTLPDDAASIVGVPLGTIGLHFEAVAASAKRTIYRFLYPPNNRLLTLNPTDDY